MSETFPHVTVIIPTRERADVLQKSLRTCTDQDYDNLTILVSDNFSADGTREVAYNAKDPRLRYVNTGERLSMSHNYEFALSHVSDGWVTIIGDDDALLPGAIRRVTELISNFPGITAIRSEVCAYRWPSLLDAQFGDLQVPLRRGSEVRDSRVWLRKVMDGAALYPNLPMLYSGGFAEVSTLLRIKAKRGSFYHSCIPDVYSAMAIASSVEEYLWVYEPLAIDGVSGHSTGTSLVRRTRDDSSVRKFFSESNIPLHPDIPPGEEGRVPRVHQAWIYESYLQSRFLREGGDERGHSDQLVVALTRDYQCADTREWASKFAARHGLDFEAALSKARDQQTRIKRLRGSDRISRALRSCYVPGDQTTPLNDVHQASIVAGDLLQSPPSKLVTIRNLGRKALTKMARR